MKHPLKPITQTYIVLLVILGLAGYFATAMQSITALIPSFFGLVVLILWLLLKSPTRLSLAKWVMVGMGTVGFLATVSALPQLLDLAQGEEVARPAATIGRSVMALLSLAYVLIILFARKDCN